LANTDVAWEKWGAQDPYFGVMSLDRFKSESIDEHRAEFFASGEERIASFLGKCEFHFGTLRKSKALDYGCGVGRLTLPLSRRFDHVTGRDISESMLAEARKNASEMKCENVTFELPNDQSPNDLDNFDFVNCYIVLQHIPTKHGVPILLELIDKVAPGGGFMVHFSLRQFNGLSRLRYWVRHNVPGMNALQNILRRRPISTPAMQMNEYPLVEILDELYRRGLRDVHTFLEKHDKVLTVGLVGRKLDERAA